jgi:hypothetical protein
MIVHHGGVQGDVSTARLPADAYPALCAYSLNRQLRKLYNGNFFRFRQSSGGEADYPASTPNLSEDVYITKIYDQKSKHGVPVQDAVQQDTSLQPKLKQVTTPSGNLRYVAEFDNKEYLDVENLAPLIGQNFTITAIGDGDIAPRPIVGIWGDNDIVTLEPSDIASRFAFNSNLGTIHDQDNSAIQCFSGYKPTQNSNYVMTVRTDGGRGTLARSQINPSFTNLSIGRQGQRFFKGILHELTIHLDELTEVGSEQLFQTARIYHGD